jgi:hypothetical protein
MTFKTLVKAIDSQQLILEDEQSNLIYWPKDKAPETITVGQILQITVNGDADGNNQSAKEILNELLKDTA